VSGNNRNTSGQSSSAASAVTQSNLLQRYNLESKLSSDDGPEPPKVWETDAQKRQEMLRKRKEHMILQARR
jgi:coupling of ubiquitin conjugation to ER degradation protein 1